MIDGIINVYKEKGWTSFDVVAKLRPLLGQKKIGHTGTLDPDAEGVLVVCLGKATKLVDRITGTDKVYEAELLLGVTTDTEDTSGTVLTRQEVSVTEDQLREAIQSFVGTYDQIPPMYSAKKVNGKKLYEYAREGKVLERKPATITIAEIHMISVELPRARFQVTCSKGTYIRSLCRDIGEKLGCGACMSDLKRTRVGRFDIKDSVSISEIEKHVKEGTIETIVSPAVQMSENCAVSFGKFDGDHIGHKSILNMLKSKAKKYGLKTAVLTFETNPQAVLSGQKRPSLTTAEERYSRLKAEGIDYIVELPFSKRISNMSAEDFLKDILVDGMKAKAIVAGSDCGFGHERRGDADMLLEHAETFGYDACIVPKEHLMEDGVPDPREISSTYIKEELSKGSEIFREFYRDSKIVACL